VEGVSAGKLSVHGLQRGVALARGRLSGLNSA